MQSVAPTQPVRTWDIVATVVLLVLLGLGGLVTTFMSLFLVMASDSCGVGGTECSAGLILLGVVVAAAAPWVAILAMGTWAVVRLFRRRTAWWVALLAIPAWGLLFALGVALTFSAVD